MNDGKRMIIYADDKSCNIKRAGFLHLHNVGQDETFCACLTDESEIVVPQQSGGTCPERWAFIMYSLAVI